MARFRGGARASARSRLRAGWAALVGGFVVLGVVSTAREARAGDATVTVGDPDALPTRTRFAEPPPRHDPIAVDPPVDEDQPVPDSWSYGHDRYRAPVRLQLGPAAVTTGRGLGMGLGVAADFGTGTVGARLAAAWTRGEARSDDEAQVAQLGSGIAQYTGELTLDLHKRGPVHPVFGMGIGLAHVNRPAGGGNAGIGTARFGVEYALGLEDADVRLGAGATFAMAGPSEREADNLRGYALIGGTLAIGF